MTLTRDFKETVTDKSGGQKSVAHPTGLGAIVGGQQN